MIAPEQEKDVEQKKYSHEITEKTVIDKSFDINMLKKMLFSPYYYELVFYKIYLYFKNDGHSKFKEEEFLKEGDEFYTCIPAIEGNDKSLWRIVRLDLDPNNLMISSELIKPSPKTSIKEALVTTSYRDGIVKLSLFTNPKNPAMLEIPRMVFKQVTHRMGNLMADFNKCYDEFVVAGSVEMQRSDKANFYGNPYEIRTQLTALCDFKSLNQSFQTHGFVHKILHSTDKQNEAQQVTEYHKKLSEGDEFKIKLNNMKLQMVPLKLEPIQEEITFEVKKCKENVVELLSNTGIYNFHQFGMRFETKQLANDKTIVEVSVYYNLSSLLSVANMGANALKSLPTFMQPAKIPDPTLIIYLRMRSMLDATIRHLCRHITENLKVKIIAATDEALSTQQKYSKP